MKEPSGESYFSKTTRIVATAQHVIVIDRHFREAENGAVAKIRIVFEKNDSPEGGLKT